MRNGGVIGYYRGEAGSDPICADCAGDWRAVNDEHPDWDVILDGSETDSFSHCDECESVIPESLTSDGVAYVLDALDEWRDEVCRGRIREAGIIEQWAERLRWYGLPRVERLRVARFERALARERRRFAKAS